MAIVGVSIPALAAAGSPGAIAATGGTPTSAAQILTNLANGGATQGGGAQALSSGPVGSQVNVLA
jgi:hypothetical protein